jgi:methylenetetrahydrofolate dehydrogenase (NADP+)/methenyltetrahydrofolate cyclohydrolase
VLGAPGPLPHPAASPELRRTGLLAGANVCVIGRGPTSAGRWGCRTRKSENATATLCHTGTVDLPLHTRESDIVIIAARAVRVWSPRDMIKPGRLCRCLHHAYGGR